MAAGRVALTPIQIFGPMMQHYNAQSAGDQARLNQAIKNVSGFGGNEAAKTCFTCLQIIAGLSLLVVGSMGAAGHFATPTFGWVIAGLGAGGIVLGMPAALSQKMVDKRNLIFTAAMAALYLTMGILGGLNHVSSVHVGWAVVAPAIAGATLGCCIGCCGPICCPDYLMGQGAKQLVQQAEIIQKEYDELAKQQ